ncbi:MAG: ribosomal protein [Candidatus Parcubacteria bacterium]|jgi:large subunit ribosomal protein L15
MHTMKPARGSKTYPKRVGRGNASGKGTTAGRGGKGQKARTGGRNNLKRLGMRRQMLQTPKLRGFKSKYAKDETVTLGVLAKEFADGAKITPKSLAKKGLASSAKARVKVLGGGNLSKKKFTVIGCEVSVAAKEVIVAAGGEVRA